MHLCPCWSTETGRQGVCLHLPVTRCNSSRTDPVQTDKQTCSCLLFQWRFDSVEVAVPSGNPLEQFAKTIEKIIRTLKIKKIVHIYSRIYANKIGVTTKRNPETHVERGISVPAVGSGGSWHGSRRGSTWRWAGRPGSSPTSSACGSAWRARCVSPATRSSAAAC